MWLGIFAKWDICPSLELKLLVLKSEETELGLLSTHMLYCINKIEPSQAGPTEAHGQ